MSRYSHIVSAAAVALASFTAAPAGADNADAARALGELVFHDVRFSNPGSDLLTSCAMCHMPSDPQGDRAFTESLARSWRPWRAEDPARETLRNTPTLFDLDGAPALHFDGEFDSVRAQTFHTLTGRNFGWLPGEEAEAMAHVLAVAREEDPEYVRLCQEAFGLDLHQTTPKEAAETLALAVEAFVLSLSSPRDTPADDFMRVNSLDDRPGTDESVEAYATRILARVEALASGKTLKLPAGFDDEALEGFRIFFATEGRELAGNCVVCHTPPSYTDFSFHNIGVTQEEYDAVHGADSYLAYRLPDANAHRPSPAHMRAPTPNAPEFVDLGFWNFANAETSPLRRAGESPGAFLERMAGAFKTPTLRHLASSAPYMHNGSYPTIESAVMLHIRSAMRGRLKFLRAPAEELLDIRINEDDVVALFAFLNTLNERGNRLAKPSAVFEGGGAYSYSVTQGSDNYPRD